MPPEKPPQLSIASAPETPAAAAPKAETRAAVGSLRPYLAIGGVFLLCLTLGWGLSFLAPDFMPAEPAAKPEHHGVRKHEPIKETPLPPINPVDEITRADGMFREGRFDAALILLQPLSQRTAAPLRDMVLYRIGLCKEGLGQWDFALTAYESLISTTADARLQAAAQLGQARIWLRARRPADAMPILAGLVLRSHHSELRLHPLMADARYLLALAHTREALTPSRPGPFLDSTLATSAVEWPLDAALDWSRVRTEPDEAGGELPVKPPPLAVDNGEDMLTTDRVGEDWLVSAGVRQRTITDLLEPLAERCKLQLQWSATARQTVAGRSIAVEVDRMPLADLLRLALESRGLAWRIKEGVLSVAHFSEVPKDEYRAYALSLARRAWRDAMASHPDHSMNALAIFESGNLCFAGGERREALAFYERLSREHPRAPVLLEAGYNTALIRRLEGDDETARLAFFRVVDRAPGSELASLAYYRIGRSFLEEGDADQAITPLRRALAAPSDSATVPAAAMALSIAYLRKDNPAAAVEILLQHRDAVGRGPYRSAAAFLNAVARFRACADRKQKQREASELLAALLDLPEDTILGSAGLMLVGQSYRDLGLHPQTAAVYGRALAGARGPLLAEASFAVADAIFTSGRHDASKELFERIANSGSNIWTARARYRLGQIALLAEKPEECLLWCRRLLEDPLLEDRADTLQLMGNAYEKLGDDRRAILCFRGQMPE